eukprot:Rhum_TRINITY_DN13932_c1_g2::Rhum_TRINITY_DN13932_c1_g2_i1::g.65549::m.65549
MFLIYIFFESGGIGGKNEIERIREEFVSFAFFFYFFLLHFFAVVVFFFLYKKIFRAHARSVHAGVWGRAGGPFRSTRLQRTARAHVRRPVHRTGKSIVVMRMTCEPVHPATATIRAPRQRAKRLRLRRLVHLCVRALRRRVAQERGGRRSPPLARATAAAAADRRVPQDTLQTGLQRVERRAVPRRERRRLVRRSLLLLHHEATTAAATADGSTPRRRHRRSLALPLRRVVRRRRRRVVPPRRRRRRPLASGTRAQRRRVPRAGAAAGRAACDGRQPLRQRAGDGHAALQGASPDLAVPASADAAAAAAVRLDGDLLACAADAAGRGRAGGVVRVETRALAAAEDVLRVVAFGRVDEEHVAAAAHEDDWVAVAVAVDDELAALRVCESCNKVAEQHVSSADADGGKLVDRDEVDAAGAEAHAARGVAAEVFGEAVQQGGVRQRVLHDCVDPVVGRCLLRRSRRRSLAGSHKSQLLECFGDLRVRLRKDWVLLLLRLLCRRRLLLLQRRMVLLRPPPLLLRGDQLRLQLLHLLPLRLKLPLQRLRQVRTDAHGARGRRRLHRSLLAAHQRTTAGLADARSEHDARRRGSSSAAAARSAARRRHRSDLLCKLHVAGVQHLTQRLHNAALRRAQQLLHHRRQRPACAVGAAAAAPCDPPAAVPWRRPRRQLLHPRRQIRREQHPQAAPRVHNPFADAAHDRVRLTHPLAAAAAATAAHRSRRHRRSRRLHGGRRRRRRRRHRRRRRGHVEFLKDGLQVVRNLPVRRRRSEQRLKTQPRQLRQAVSLGSPQGALQRGREPPVVRGSGRRRTRVEHRHAVRPTVGPPVLADHAAVPPHRHEPGVAAAARTRRVRQHGALPHAAAAALCGAHARARRQRRRRRDEHDVVDAVAAPPAVLDDAAVGPPHRHAVLALQPVHDDAQLRVGRGVASLRRRPRHRRPQRRLRQRVVHNPQVLLCDRELLAAEAAGGVSRRQLTDAHAVAPLRQRRLHGAVDPLARPRRLQHHHLRRAAPLRRRRRQRARRRRAHDADQRLQAAPQRPAQLVRPRRPEHGHDALQHARLRQLPRARRHERLACGARAVVVAVAAAAAAASASTEGGRRSSDGGDVATVCDTPRRPLPAEARRRGGVLP